MRKLVNQFFVWLCVFFISSVAYASNNPLPVKFGDPYVLLASDGRYYMYGTGAGAVDGFVLILRPTWLTGKPKGSFFVETSRGRGAWPISGHRKFTS
jgi:hypothetical protein